MQNPPLGEDIDSETLHKISNLMNGSYTPNSNNENAQLRELAFWRWVAYEGYNGKPPEYFPTHQQQLMTHFYKKTGWDINKFSTKSIFELGCGPLGMIEYIPARYKYAFDPLNQYYSKLFRDARSKDITYISKESQIAEIPAVAFGICFNVLDHTPDAKKYLDLFFSKIITSGHFVIQVNTIRNDLERTESHKSMHPSPLTYEQISQWIKLYSKDFQFELSSTPSTDNEFSFICWGTKYSN